MELSHRNCPGSKCPGFSSITALVSKCLVPRFWCRSVLWPKCPVTYSTAQRLPFSDVAGILGLAAEAQMGLSPKAKSDRGVVARGPINGVCRLDCGGDKHRWTELEKKTRNLFFF